MLLVLPFILLCISTVLYCYGKNKYHAICWEVACFLNILLSNIVFFGLLLYVMFIRFPDLVFVNQLISVATISCVLSSVLVLLAVLCNYKDIKEDISEYLHYGSESDYVGSCLSRIMQEVNFAIPTLLFSIILVMIDRVQLYARK
ncbi:hypothetical protein [Candidatus Neoehrlichia procyonis]|uniref:Putative membrane protein n=1 Tax=Candidatus Neoehrlichia procyonis str. RAC413 TaxID=1359163 RepID=A0A0F3NM48_9RICK|nr:hypothetical protein [Candidatus Neoehrlichia lotoris]KJV69100.1 putative membrane protein [Candidatus Neoehrlichia lotoris str. RAC413]